MMDVANLMKNELYLEDVKHVADLDLPWEKFCHSNVLISGATGLIGSFLVDVLQYRNRHYGMDCHIIAIGRNEERAKRRFGEYMQEGEIAFVAHNINLPLGSGIHYDGRPFSFVLHLASNTHPLQYSSEPIATIETNILGTKNLLDFAVSHNTERFVFASSNEIYGENRGDVELFDEDYLGYLNSNTLRAGYPESKRCGEALCQAYAKEKGLDVVIPRFTRTYGPTMLSKDSKAMSQFLKRAIEGEDIVLKSKGEQFYSYCYVADAVSGLLTICLCGKSGEAYNIADKKSDIRLKDLAAEIAHYVGKNVIFEIPDEKEAAGYSTATKARLNGMKLYSLGWTMRYDIQDGARRTINILRGINNGDRDGCI